MVTGAEIELFDQGVGDPFDKLSGPLGSGGTLQEGLQDEL
jgi:hypothetical protein